MICNNLISDKNLMIFFENRYIGRTDSVTISIWNQKKVHKKQGAGFLGCVKIMPNAIQTLKDTGCEIFLSNI